MHSAYSTYLGKISFSGILVMEKRGMGMGLGEPGNVWGMGRMGKSDFMYLFIW